MQVHTKWKYFIFTLINDDNQITNVIIYQIEWYSQRVSQPALGRCDATPVLLLFRSDSLLSK